MRTCQFEQSLRNKHYQRLSATLIVNAEETFSFQAGNANIHHTNIALLSPGSRRNYMKIAGGDCFLFDLEITSEAFSRLRSMLPIDGGSTPPSHITDAVMQKVKELRNQEINACDAVMLFDDVIGILVADTPPAKVRDGRIDEVLRKIDESCRDEVTVAGLAKLVGLSESRLRSLVQKELGCSLSRYLRWATAWKTAELWRPGVTLTEVAHAAGFHDLSHANRTFIELFGLSPSKVLKSDQIRLERCDKYSPLAQS